MMATKSHPCSLCRREAKPDEMVPDGELIAGRRWYYSDGTTTVYRGYVCDFHLEDFKSYRFLTPKGTTRDS